MKLAECHIRVHVLVSDGFNIFQWCCVPFQGCLFVFAYPPDVGVFEFQPGLNSPKQFELAKLYSLRGRLPPRSTGCTGHVVVCSHLRSPSFREATLNKQFLEHLLVATLLFPTIRWS